MGRKRHASLSEVCCRVQETDRILDVLSSLGTKTFGWMAMYGSAPLSNCVVLKHSMQGIREPNGEYADGDYVD